MFEILLGTFGLSVVYVGIVHIFENSFTSIEEKDWYDPKYDGQVFH